MRMNISNFSKGIVLVLVAATMLSGCNKSTDNGNKEPAAQTTQKPAETTQAPTAVPEDISIKDAYADCFSIGAAVNSWQLADSDTMAVITKHFSSITTENEMKPDYILDYNATLEAKDGMPVINMDNVDHIMDMAQDAGLKMRGHTLVWHSQTPDWLFREDYNIDNDYVDRDTMLTRMESYISQVMTHVKDNYPGLLYAWDVVNEALTDEAGGGFRKDSPWYITIGEDYVEKAFEFARKYAADDMKLFINDYNLTLEDKMNTMYELASDLYAKGLIDGIGMQSHHDMEYFNVEQFEKALFKYAQLEGIEIQLTELDLHNTDNSDEGYEKQADMYKEMFDIIVDLDTNNMANITNVTFWGLNDGGTWLTNHKGETSYPLLLDENNKEKPCYKSIISAITGY